MSEMSRPRRPRGRPAAERPLDHLIPLKVDAGLAEAYKRLAATNERTIQGEVRHAMRRHLDERDRELTT